MATVQIKKTHTQKKNKSELNQPTKTIEIKKIKIN